MQGRGGRCACVCVGGGVRGAVTKNYSFALYKEYVGGRIKGFFLFVRFQTVKEPETVKRKTVSKMYFSQLRWMISVSILQSHRVHL